MAGTLDLCTVSGVSSGDLVGKRSRLQNLTFSRPSKRLRSPAISGHVAGSIANPFESITEEILFLLLDRLQSSPIDVKSFALVCRSFYAAESRHRRTLTPLRADLLPAVLARYTSATRVDLTLCPRVGDAALAGVGSALRSSLAAIDLSRSRGFSQAGIEALVMNCGALVEMNLSNAVDLCDSAAAAIGRARNLERLWMSRCMMVTDMGIGCIAVGCAKLKFLCLKWCVGITDLGVGLVAVKCKQIHNLDLSYMQITKKCLPAIMQLPKLQELALAGCLGIDDEALVSVKYGCRSLEVLDVSNCQHISPYGFSSLLNKTLGLRRISLAYYCTITESLTGSLRKLSELRAVKLDGCDVTTSGLKDIANSSIQLQELSLSKCSGVTDEGLSSIVTKHKGLVKLDITCCRKITDVSLANITSSCSSLSSLRMESCVLVSKEGFRLIGQNCHLLDELDLTDNDLDDEGLKHISRCHNLSSLKIGICLKISDEGLMHLGKSCSKLKELDLYRSVRITDVGVKALAHGCPLLQVINLAYCTQITDDALRSLARCSNLNTLEIRGCPQVSSSGIAAVAVGCKELNKLDIKKCCYIDDAGMLMLARFCNNLRQINLSYCSVTDVGLLALASISCLQSMIILHVSGLTPCGLAAALLACGGLTKVKLHVSFKQLISGPLLEHIEARGCSFQWLDKPFQVEMESTEVWKQQSQDMHV